MKTLVCEVCGSNELVKEGDLFVCPYCGTKYTPDAAKKLLVEGTVDVSGSSVKIDRSEELEKLYQSARNAKEISDDTTALKHYEAISAKDPNSWEAMFYCVILKTNSVKYGEINSSAISVINCIKSVVRLIRENLEEENQKEALVEVGNQCYETAMWLIDASLEYYRSLKKGNGLTALTGLYGLAASVKSGDEAFREHTNRCLTISEIFTTFGDTLLENGFDQNGDEEYKELIAWSFDKIFEVNNKYKNKFHINLFNDQTLDMCDEMIDKYRKNAEEDEEGTGEKKKIMTHADITANKRSKLWAFVSILYGVSGAIFTAFMPSYGFVGGILGIIFGLVAKKKCPESGNKNLAKAGIIISAVVTVISIPVIIVFMINN